MKKALNITAVLAFMLTTVVSTAKEVKTGSDENNEVKPLVLNLDANEIIKPTFRTKGKMVYMNHLNLDGKKVEVRVQDDSGNVIYTTTFNESVIVEKAFNFEQADAGLYKVILKEGNKTYYENVLVK
ncbi:hypothetical protein SB49_01125 [Sediminicola sp. YIK13]|uniref:hypothetical protein n=1 Tax=Sediminicola sp. YIK13 TaxID=1453352 RepID=UPI00071EB027|nr:hypothetical protein [Sediminicola sp. YIK13]ALM06564.1 hypothetical protein SB49_01125 [Sediminicola sp. YIK13]